MYSLDISEITFPATGPPDDGEGEEEGADDFVPGSMIENMLKWVDTQLEQPLDVVTPTVLQHCFASS